MRRPFSQPGAAVEAVEAVEVKSAAHRGWRFTGCETSNWCCWLLLCYLFAGALFCQPGLDQPDLDGHAGEIERGADGRLIRGLGWGEIESALVRGHLGAFLTTVTLSHGVSSSIRTWTPALAASA